MSGSLTAARLRSYLHEVELPARLDEIKKDDGEKIIRYGSFVGSELVLHDRLDRAMDRGRLHIDTLDEKGKSVRNGRIILAETLTGPKGRFTRRWHAPYGGLWGCLLHATTLTPPSAMLLSLSLGVAACESIRLAGVENAHIRWVNDVIVDQAKIAGFLVESHTAPKHKELFHLIGFGINVNNSEFPPELENVATSLGDILGHEVNLDDFSLDFIAKLAWNIGMLYFIEAERPFWHEEKDVFVHPVIKRWRKLSDTLGRRVVYGYDVLEKPQYQAEVVGIEGDGGLRMVLEDGTPITEHSGEVRYL